MNISPEISDVGHFLYEPNDDYHARHKMEKLIYVISDIN
jgi:hypothetical protein